MSPMTRIALKRAIRCALYAGAATMAVPVHAANEPADANIQEIVVTGSFIPMNAAAPGVPVTIMTAEDIQNSSTPTDLLDVLKKTQPGALWRSEHRLRERQHLHPEPPMADR